jgi:CBS domain containing-hemolysin-like protein
MFASILASVSTGGGASKGVCPAVVDCPPEEWLFLALWVGGALFISFMCSLLEAVVMSVNVYRLKAMASENNAGAIRMLKVKDKTEDSIAAILSLNTVAHTVGATLSGAQALKMFGNEAMAIFSAILTLLILVLTEIIPKNAGERYPEKFSGFSSLLLLKFIVPIMTPIVFANRFLVKILYGEHEESLDRATVGAIHETALEDGAIDAEEGIRINRVMSLTNKVVKDIMIGRADMPLLNSDSTLRELSKYGKHSHHTRILVQGNGPEDILGYVFLEEAFRTVLLERNNLDSTLAVAKRLLTDDVEGSPLIRQLNSCKEDVEAKKVLRSMLESGHQIVLVYNDAGSVSGMITLEEFLEYLIDGEIRDEDEVLINVLTSTEEKST